MISIDILLALFEGFGSKVLKYLKLIFRLAYKRS